MTKNIFGSEYYSMPRGRRRGGLGGQFVGTSGTTGGTGGVSAPAPERVSTTVKRLPDGSKIITTRDFSTGQVISTTFKDPQGRTTTTPPPGVSSTGEVIEEKKPRTIGTGERFETSVPGRFGFAGGRVTAIFEGSKRTGARKVFEPTVSQIDRPGKEPITVTRLKEPSIGVVASEREAEIKKRGGRGLTEQQLQEAELIARREAPKAIQLPPGEAERIELFFKEFGLTRGEDIFKGVETGKLEVLGIITRTPEGVERGIKVTARTPRVIIPPAPGEKISEEDKQMFGVTQKIVGEGREFAAILKGEDKLKSLTPIGESIQETKIGRLLDVVGGFTGVAATTLAGGVSSFLEPPAFELFRRPTTTGVPETITLEELELKRERRREEFFTGTLTLGFLGAAVTDITPFRFPVREPTKIVIRPGVKPEFPKPRVGDRAGIERGFQPRSETRGLVPSKELQATLREPARLSRADLFEEIRLTKDPLLKVQLTKQLGKLIEPEPTPTRPGSVEAFLRERFIAEETARAGREPTFIGRERILKNLRTELEKPQRILFPEGRQTPLERFTESLERVRDSKALEESILRRRDLKSETIIEEVLGVRESSIQKELTAFKDPFAKVKISESNIQTIVVKEGGKTRTFLIDIGKKGQQSLIPGERVFERATSFFGLEPGEVFRPTPRVQVPSLEVVKPTTKIGFVPLTLDISKKAVVARTGIESRVENLLELSADLRLGQAQRVGQELDVLQRTSTLQRTGQTQIQEGILDQVLEQELVTPETVVTPRVTTKLDLRIGEPTTPPPPTRPPPTPPPGLPLLIPSAKANQGFDVLVRESRPKGKSKRAFFKVNAEPLPENKALNLGGDIVDNSSARTFKIVKSKRTTETRDDIMFNKSHKFRRPRGRTRLPSGSYVEETTHLIDTPGERRGITAKGLIALRTKRKKAKNLVGNKEAFGTIRELVGRGQSLRSIREMLK